MHVKIIRKIGRKNRILKDLAGFTRRRKDNIKEEAWIVCRGKDLKVMLS